MTYTVEILNEHALNLLQELERLHIIRLKANGADQTTSKKKEFTAIRLNTRGFKFNREEANER